MSPEGRRKAARVQAALKAQREALVRLGEAAARTSDMMDEIDGCRGKVEALAARWPQWIAACRSYTEALLAYRAARQAVAEAKALPAEVA